MAALQLVIGNKNYSSWSLRPWLLLKHLGLEFDEICLDLTATDFHQAIQCYSKAGKVPVLLDGDLLIRDSLAICEYLGEQHPCLWPLDLKQRALARSAVAEMHAGFMSLRSELPMNCRAHKRALHCSPQTSADISRISELWQECLDSHHNEGPWLFGEFSIADAYFAPLAIRFSGYDIALDSCIERYCQTQFSNPYLQQWLEQGRAESAQLKAAEAGD